MLLENKNLNTKVTHFNIGTMKKNIIEYDQKNNILLKLNRASSDLFRAFRALRVDWIAHEATADWRELWAGGRAPSLRPSPTSALKIL